MTTPYALLLDLQQRYQTVTASLPQTLAGTEYWRGIGFALAGQQYAVAMSSVNEIIHPPKLTRIPRVKSWVLGVANIRGRLVPVIDLAGLFALPVQASWRTRRIMVIEQGDTSLGFLVDAMLGMQNFNHNQQISIRPEHAKLEPFIEFGFNKDGQDWPVFNFNKLLQSTELSQVRV